MRHDKNRIVLCQLYHPQIHGKNNNLVGHYLCEYIYKCPFKYTLKYRTNVYYRNFMKHNENCETTIPEIATVIYLQSGECVCVLKTFWIRIFQRIWKSYWMKLQKKKNLRYLLNRELTISS